MKDNTLWATAGIAAVVSLIMILLFGGHGKTGTTNQSVYQKMLATGELRCGYFVEPPYFMKDGNNGAISGIIPDMLNEIGKGAEVTFKFDTEIPSLGTMLEDLNLGKYDAVCGSLFFNPNRSKRGLFTKAIAYAPLYGVVRANETRIKPDLSNLNSGTFSITAMEGEGGTMNAQKRFPQAKFTQLPQMADITLMTTSVADGKADITFVSPDVFKRFNKSTPGKLKVLSYEHPLMVTPIALMVKADEQALANFIDTSIDYLQGTGKMDELYKKYDPDGDLLRRPALPYIK